MFLLSVVIVFLPNIVEIVAKQNMKDYSLNVIIYVTLCDLDYSLLM